MIDLGTQNKKKLEREEIEKQIEAFNEKGGKITKLPSYMESNEVVKYNVPMSMKGFINNENR